MPGYPVPDIATLRAICHSGKLATDRRPVYVLTRRVSIYLTWLLLHTGIRPNQVTMVTVALGVTGSALLSLPGPGWAIAGALVLLAHHLVDKVDGDIARFRKIYSIIGVYLDELGHGLAFAGIFVGLGLHLAWGAEGAWRIGVLAAAAVGAVAMVLGRHHKSIGFQLYAQHVLAHPELRPREEEKRPWTALSREATHQDRGGAGGRRSGIARLRDAVLQLSDFSLMVLLVLAGALVELWTGRDSLLRATLIAEAALQSAVLTALVAVNVAVNVESEVRRLDRMARAGDGNPTDTP